MGGRGETQVVRDLLHTQIGRNQQRAGIADAALHLVKMNGLVRILVKKAIEIKRVVAEHAAKAIGGDAFAGVRLQILLEPLHDGWHRFFSGFGLAHKLQ